MKNIFKRLTVIFLVVISASCATHKPFQIDYEKEIPLDAEALAECGILQAYQKLKPELSRYVKRIEPIEEIIDNDAPSYQIKFRGETLGVYGPDISEVEMDSWMRATYVLLYVVNSQLKGSNVKLYALGGGNDLGGMFLTVGQVEDANNSATQELDKFYLPNLSPSGL